MHHYVHHHVSTTVETGISFGQRSVRRNVSESTITPYARNANFRSVTGRKKLARMSSATEGSVINAAAGSCRYAPCVSLSPFSPLLSLISTRTLSPLLSYPSRLRATCRVLTSRRGRVGNEMLLINFPVPWQAQSWRFARTKTRFNERSDLHRATLTFLFRRQRHGVVVVSGGGGRAESSRSPRKMWGMRGRSLGKRQEGEREGERKSEKVNGLVDTGN